MWEVRDMSPSVGEAFSSALKTYTAWLDDTDRNTTYLKKLNSKLENEEYYIFSLYEVALAMNAVTFTLCNCKLTDEQRRDLLWLNHYFLLPDDDRNPSIT